MEIKIRLCHDREVIERLERIERKLDELLRFHFTVKFYVEGEEITMLTMTDSQQANVKLVILDSKQKPAQVDGVPVWTTSDATVAAVTPAADGMSALVVAGNGGPALITVTCDADLGPGVTPIIGTLDVTITGGAATIIQLQADAPVEQP